MSGQFTSPSTLNLTYQSLSSPVGRAHLGISNVLQLL